MFVRSENQLLILQPWLTYHCLCDIVSVRLIGVMWSSDWAKVRRDPGLIGWTKRTKTFVPQTTTRHLSMPLPLHGKIKSVFVVKFSSDFSVFKSAGPSAGELSCWKTGTGARGNNLQRGADGWVSVAALLPRGKAGDSWTEWVSIMSLFLLHPELFVFACVCTHNHTFLCMCTCLCSFALVYMHMPCMRFRAILGIIYCCKQLNLLITWRRFCVWVLLKGLLRRQMTTKGSVRSSSLFIA